MFKIATLAYQSVTLGQPTYLFRINGLLHQPYLFTASVLSLETVNTQTADKKNKILKILLEDAILVFKKSLSVKAIWCMKAVTQIS